MSLNPSLDWPWCAVSLTTPSYWEQLRWSCVHAPTGKRLPDFVWDEPPTSSVVEITALWLNRSSYVRYPFRRGSFRAPPVMLDWDTFDRVVLVGARDVAARLELRLLGDCLDAFAEGE